MTFWLPLALLLTLITPSLVTAHWQTGAQEKATVRANTDPRYQEIRRSETDAENHRQFASVVTSAR